MKCLICGKELQDNEKQCSICGANISQMTPQNQHLSYELESQKNNALIEYVRKIVVLEREVYEQKKLLYKIKNKYNSYSNPRLKAKKELAQYHLGWGDIIMDFSDVSEGFILESIGLFIGGLFIASLSQWNILGTIIGLFFCAPMVIFVLSLIIVPFVNLFKYKNESRNIKMYNIKAQEDNRIWKDKCKSICQRLDKEYRGVNANLKQTEQILKEYYDLDVIYPKYRNFVCMASVLDYLQSGICTQLTGHEGAYRILEEDIKFRRIENKLDIVIKKLDEIKETQYSIYMAIQEANNNLNSIGTKIDSSTKQIVSNQKNINEKLDTISYNQRIQEKNTEIIKDISIYTHLKNK